MLKSLRAHLRSPYMPIVLVGALGYFVDIYDLVLFSIVRVPSLQGIGVPAAELLDVGVLLINVQMVGMLLGGLLWGVLGDRKGRVSVLYGSIFLYSTANLANAFVHSVPAYAFWRFVAGLGLAGELGAAITLVSEIMPKEIRGYGTAIVAAVGICGAVAAGTIGEAFSWQVSYIVGGALGFLLLLLRLRSSESSLFENIKHQPGAVRRGDLRLLFAKPERVLRYAQCILIGVPVWYTIGILITFSPELARELGATEPVSAGRAILFCYAGLAVGDLASGFLSQWLRSRRRVFAAFLALTGLGFTAYFALRGLSAAQFYAVCALIGVGVGYWAIFVSVAAEQFGTNLRATVATTVPNFVRGSVVPLAIAFRWMGDAGSLTRSAIVLGAICMALALLSLWKMRETFGCSLDFIEE